MARRVRGDFYRELAEHVERRHIERLSKHNRMVRKNREKDARYRQRVREAKNRHQDGA